MITFPNIITLLKLALDLFLVWILFYYLIGIVRKNMRTLQIFKGILIVLLFKLITTVLDLTTFESLVDMVLMWGAVAIFVIFQPEIRTTLEKMGKSSLTSSSSLDVDDLKKERIINEITKAIEYFSNTKTGALITFELNQSLEDYINAGTVINADISFELLLTIFYDGTALHDGGMIIQGDKIACASAFYEPTSRELSPIYGARHRAALGLSEVTDSLTIIVSEETGNVSFVREGHLKKVPLPSFKNELIIALGWDGSEKRGDDNE